MGAVDASVSHTAVMPEVLVRREDRYLLVRGTERGDVFWWPPGAYWVQAGTCDLTTTDPVDWIRATLQEQIGVPVTQVALRGVSLVDVDHAPVLTYAASVAGDPRPNPELGFDRAEFFAPSEMPERLGRDEVHGRWLRSLLGAEHSAEHSQG